MTAHDLMDDLTDEELEEVEQLSESLLERYGTYDDEVGVWDYVGDMIIEVTDECDLDRLRVYDKFNHHSDVNFIMLDQVMDYYQRSSESRVASFLTIDRIYAIWDTGQLLARIHKKGIGAYLPRECYPLVRLVLDNLPRYREVIRLMDQRDIGDEEKLKALLTEMDEHHAASTPGIL